ncbi:MAG TPA: PKD domain-containing protein, partial [Myxococcus sp.]|nr:PKD domain-containing protein [Myxococcus sp.]
MSTLPYRLALLALCATGLWACDSAPGPQQPPANTPPTLRLFLPDGPTPLRVGQRMNFHAAVEDAEEGTALRERVLWVSSREGQLARGPRASITFQEAGPCTLTASVVDSGGQAASASLTLEVLAPEAPEVSVRKPVPGSAFNLGEVLELECRALGVDGEPLPPGAVSWTSALSGTLPPGASSSARLVVAGEDTLTCTAEDPATRASASASVRVTVRPTRAPAVLITLPERPEVYVKAGEAAPFSSTVRFRATAQDFNTVGVTGDLDGAIQWTLEPGGVALGTGAGVTHTFTTPGEYTVTARAVDGRGNAAVDSVRVRLVGNLPPRCEIDTPHDDHTRLRRDVSSRLEGRCVDPETGAPAAVTWRTSASTSPLGTGESLDAVFTVGGAQVLSACAVDPDDAALKGCAERPVHVIVNTAPEDCAIQLPLPVSTVNAGRPLVLEGSASDAQDPRGDLRFEWTSSRDGTLGLGASTSTRRLSTPGSHWLTLTVTDPWGQACTAAVRVEVNGAPEVRVDSVRQDNVSCLASPCRADQPVVAEGFAEDSDSAGGVAEVAWLDSLTGALAANPGNPPGTTLPSPPAGRHTLVLLAEDRSGAVGRAAVSFTVLPSGSTRLLEEVLQS